VDDGAAKRLDRAALKALGNSVHPDIPEAIGRAILEVAA
jgi:site-specific DNA-cytosine methylase